MDAKETKTFLLRGFHHKCIIKNLVLWEISVFIGGGFYYILLHFSKIYNVEFFSILNLKLKLRCSSFSFDSFCVFLLSFFPSTPILQSFVCFLVSRGTGLEMLASDLRILDPLSVGEEFFKNLLTTTFFPHYSCSGHTHLSLSL